MARTNEKNQKDNKKITTIKIYVETKERMDKLKEHVRESYDDVLKKVLFILNYLKKDPEKARKILSKIDSSIKIKEEYTEVSSEKKEKGNEKSGERK